MGQVMGFKGPGEHDDDDDAYSIRGAFTVFVSDSKRERERGLIASRRGGWNDKGYVIFFYYPPNF